jgi:hypothetical protein
LRTRFQSTPKVGSAAQSPREVRSTINTTSIIGDVAVTQRLPSMSTSPVVGLRLRVTA